MEFNRERVRNDVRQATTEDLLNRATVYRAEMEPQALAIIEQELRSRGVNSDRIRSFEAANREDVLRERDGTAKKCSFCDRPAVDYRWGWHFLWGKLPIFPRLYRFCAVHDQAPPRGNRIERRGS